MTAMKVLPAFAALVSSFLGLAAAAEPQVIASGLANPRGLGFSSTGQLYVAEAGAGGDSDVCVPAPEPPGSTRCLGYTGAVSRVDTTGSTPPKRILKHLPSLAVEPGVGPAEGVFDLAFGPYGQMFILTGLGGDPAERRNLGKASYFFGKVHWVGPFGVLVPVGDIVRHEQLRNPAGGALDSNPYGLAALLFRRVVADAGGNSLVQALANGHTRTLAVFPDQLVPAPPFLGLPPGTQIPSQAVPTCVVEGPDGLLYVGQLTGFPFPVGGARIYRLPPEGGTPEVYATGFTNIIDIAFGHNGELYVLEIFKNGLLAGPPGRLVKIASNGVRTTVADGLILPGGVAVGPDGAVYVTNFGTSATDGQVLKYWP
jgi:hypothetical protein